MEPRSPLRTRKKIRFDTDLVLIRILNYLSPQGTTGERCSRFREALDDYKEIKQGSRSENSQEHSNQLPACLEDLEDPYGSVIHLLDICLEGLEEYDATRSLIESTEVAPFVRSRSAF